MNIRYIIVTKDKVLFDQFGIISSFHEIKCNDSTKFRFSEICRDKNRGRGEICLVSFHLNQDGNYVSLINIDNR